MRRRLSSLVAALLAGALFGLTTALPAEAEAGRSPRDGACAWKTDGTVQAMAASYTIFAYGGAWQEDDLR